MGKAPDQLQGTLELLVLRTLASAREPLHGFGIAERIEQVSAEALRVEEGSLYPALHRMNEEGWVQSEWGASSNNRRARFYRITTKGRRRLTQLERDWTRHVAAVKRVIRHA
jgi:PadR family transcriptional regulator, regulatory protein PadR